MPGDPAIALVLEASDTPVSTELQRAYFADIASRYPGWSPDLIPSADPAEVAPPVGAWVVAYLGDQPVGCGGIKRLDDTSAELKRIYLAAAARGHGLGRLILEQLEQHARDLGYERLRLDTGDRQPEALGLFHAAGYEQIADYNGNTWATYWMEKRLPPRTERPAVERGEMFFATAAEFEAWLEANGADADADEVLVRMAKKHTGVASLDWAGAVDVVLCFGWIDGRSKRIDDDWFVQRFTPRRPQSRWSKVNRQKVEALIAAGRMRPAGLAEIERAKADGRWEAAYDGMATSAVPEDLAAALEAAGLTDAFAELSRQNRYAILHRVQTAKKAETRERRIAKYVGMLAAGETPY